MSLKTANIQYQKLLKEWQELVKEKGIDLSDTETNGLNKRLINAKKNLEYLKKIHNCNNIS